MDMNVCDHAIYKDRLSKGNPGKKIHQNSQSAHHFEHRIFQTDRSSSNSGWRWLIIQSSTLTYEQHTKSMHSFPN